MRKNGSKTIVLDAWAMMAYLQNEPGAQEVRQALRKAHKREIRVLFTLMNYGECLYVIERRQGPRQAQFAVGIIDSLPLSVIPPDRSLVFATARLKARYPISYADAFSAALAQRHGARLMTGDPEFKAVEPELSIHWLPARRK